VRVCEPQEAIFIKGMISIIYIEQDYISDFSIIPSGARVNLKKKKKKKKTLKGFVKRGERACILHDGLAETLVVVAQARSRREISFGERGGSECIHRDRTWLPAELPDEKRYELSFIISHFVFLSRC